jgi:hypothetical protein
MAICICIRSKISALPVLTPSGMPARFICDFSVITVSALAKGVNATNISANSMADSLMLLKVYAISRYPY